MEISWRIREGFVEKMWRFCVRSIIVEKMWRNHRESVEVLWNLDGETTESLWNICGKIDVEKLWKTNTLENRRLENIKDALQWSSTRTNRRDGKMFRKIVDWARTDSGKEVLTGVFWGFVGIIAVRLFCFLVCLATGYPADIWHIFG